MTGWYGKLFACGMAGVMALAGGAAAETGTSGWVQRTKPAAITQPPKKRRRAGKREVAPRRTKSKVVPAPKSVTTTQSLGQPAKLPKSTLGPIMADPSGDDAAYMTGETLTLDGGLLAGSAASPG